MDSFGMKLGLEGEKEFKSAIKDINDSMKVLGSEMTLVASQFDKQDKSEQAVTARSTVLSKEIESQKEKIETLRATLSNASESFGENDRRTQQWQIQLNKAQAELNGMERELKNNSDALNLTGDELNDAGGNADDFGEEIEDAGDGAEKAGGERMTELGEQAQAAGYVLSGDTLNAYGELDDQLQYLKVGADTAKNALGTILMPALTELATDGVSMLGDFTNGIKNANGDWGEIGEVIGGAVEGILEKVNEFLPQLTEVAVVMITAITTGIADNTDGIPESAMQIMTTLLSALTELLPLLLDVAGQLLFALADGPLTNLPMIVESALQVVLTLAEGISEALPELVPRIVEVVVQIVSTLLENVPMLIEAALSIILALAQGIEEALPELAAAVPQIISSIVTAIIASLPELLPAAVDIIFSLIDGILGALPELIAMVPNIIIGIIQGLLDNLEQSILFAPEIITALITGLIGAIPELIMALPRIIMSIVDTFRDYDWGSIGTNLMEGLIEGIGGMAAKVIMKIYEVAKGIYDEICDSFGIHSPSTLFADIGGYLLEGLWNGIADMKSWLVDKIRSLGSTVTEALKSVLGIHSPSTVFETQIGKNLALGLGVGFEKAMRTVRDDMAQAVPTDFDIDADVNASLRGRDAKTSDGGVTVILNIDTFNNNTDSDIHDLADELSVILAAKLSRKDAVFA